MWLMDGDRAAWQALNKRQQFKYRYLNRVWLPYFYFFLQFIIKRGSLDGQAGLHFALLKLRYFQDIRRKIKAAGCGGEVAG